MNQATEFLLWWRSQLRELMPQALRRLWATNGRRRGNTLSIELDNQRALISSTVSDSQAECDLRPGAETHPTTQLDALLAGPAGTPQRLRLVLSRGQFLMKRFGLPRAARPHLTEAVGYQLPKLTPFTADQVFYACGVASDDPGTGQLPVWLVVIPRQRLQKLLVLLGQPQPPNPLPLRQAPDDEQQMELIWRVSERSRVSGRRRWQLAWLGMLVAWVAAFTVHIQDRNLTIRHLEEVAAELRSEASEIGMLRERLSATTQQIDHLNQRRAAIRPSLSLLESLTQLLDDQSSLQRLDFDGTTVALTGFSTSPSTLIETLEGSRAFSAVRFDAFTRDVRTQADRFNLSATVAAPVAEGTR